MDCVVNHVLQKVGKMFVATAVAFTIVGGASLAGADLPKAAPRSLLPHEFGDVIYQKHPDRPNQIFIVGQSHRSAATGANGRNTVQAQAEIYRIGEWLIRQEGVRLLLPEGYFQRDPETVPVASTVSAVPLSEAPVLDNETLRVRLSDTSAFVNADMLLRNSFSVRLHQVEDEGIYRGVREFMQTAALGVPLGWDEQLDYLQEIRSAAMLQNVPAAIDAEFRAGTIAQKRAMFTVGMAHLDEIIRFFNDEKIEVTPPAVSPASFREYSAVLKLIQEGYGVTIILPRSLIEDREALKMVRLDTI